MTHDSADSYIAACERAATNQGLDPATQAVDRLLGSDGWYVEQTGGFCMVLVVPDPRDPLYVFMITSESDAEDGSPLYLVCRSLASVWFGDEEWSEETDTCVGSDVSADHVAALVTGSVFDHVTGTDVDIITEV